MNGHEWNTPGTTVTSIDGENAIRLLEQISPPVAEAFKGAKKLPAGTAIEIAALPATPPTTK